MKTIQDKKQKIHKLIDSLPLERLHIAEVLLEQLQNEARVDVKEGKIIVRLGGLWKDLGVEISEDDIAEARREMWEQMGKDNK